MERWVVAGTLDDLWEGDTLAVSIDGRAVLLCNVEGAIFAYGDLCPHLGNPLSKGRLEAHVLTCAAHEWSFDVRTGAGINPTQVCLHRYPIRLEGDRIFVDMDAGDE